MKIAALDGQSNLKTKMSRSNEKLRTISRWFFLEGFRIPQKGTVEIYLNTATGEPAKIVLTGVVMLKASAFKESNIIFDVTIRDGNEITLGDIAELYDLQPDRQPAEWETQLLQKAISEHFHLFEISSSYGGTCLVLSQTVEFR